MCTCHQINKSGATDRHLMLSSTSLRVPGSSSRRPLPEERAFPQAKSTFRLELLQIPTPMGTSRGAREETPPAREPEACTQNLKVPCPRVRSRKAGRRPAKGTGPEANQDCSRTCPPPNCPWVSDAPPSRVPASVTRLPVSASEEYPRVQGEQNPLPRPRHPVSG